MPDRVRIRVLRRYPRGGTVYNRGAEILVPPYAVDGIVSASPPFGEVLEEVPEGITLPADDEKLPPGYEREGGRGGYYRLFAPDGSEIAGPSAGKWQGKDASADAAWAHFEGRLAPEATAYPEAAADEDSGDGEEGSEA